MSELDCIFCKIIRGELFSYKVYEGEKTLAFLDIRPVRPGHTLVITKTHEPRLENLTDEDREALFKTVQKLVDPVQRSQNAPSSNIAINNGKEAGQIIPHVHVHIIPRTKFRGRQIIDHMGRAKPRSPEFYQETAKKIMTEIEAVEKK